MGLLPAAVEKRRGRNDEEDRGQAMNDEAPARLNRRREGLRSSTMSPSGQEPTLDRDQRDDNRRCHG